MDKVRVLHVIGSMNRAGAETVVMNLMRFIDRSRFQFDFLVHEASRCDYDDEIEELGGTIYRIPRYRVYNASSYRRECRRFFEAHPEIQVVHGHIGSCGSIYLDEANRAGCTTIAHSHSVQSNRVFHRAFYRLLVRNLRDVADEFLGCSVQAGIGRFGADVASGPHFHVMKNGIEPVKYVCDDEGHRAAKAKLGYADVPLVGNVGRLVIDKNQKHLLDVFACVLKEKPEARLVIAGRGSLESDLRNQAQELGIAESVDFLGVRDDVPEILKALDVFVFPSFREGLPVALVEAQAAGAMCVASDTLTREVFISEYAESLALDAGVDAWAQRIVEALDHPMPRVDMSAAIRESGFDIREVARSMGDFYEELAQRSAR